MTQINPNEILKRKIISNILNPGEQIQQVGIDLTCKEEVIIHPGDWNNFEYTEQFNMQDTFGLTRIRSSLARKGLVLQSGIFDPGFKGIGGCVLHNFSEKRILLPAGFRVGQMIVFKADAASEYDGHYNKNKTIQSQYSGVKLE